MLFIENVEQQAAYDCDTELVPGEFFTRKMPGKILGKKCPGNVRGALLGNFFGEGGLIFTQNYPKELTPGCMSGPQDCKCVRVSVMIWAIEVNTQTHTVTYRERQTERQTKRQFFDRVCYKLSQHELHLFKCVLKYPFERAVSTPLAAM